MNTFCISGRRDPGQLPALRQGEEYTVIGNKDGISVYIGGQLPATPDTDTRREDLASVSNTPR